MTFHKVKQCIRSLQELLERHVLGAFFQEWGWRLRHLYRRGWAEDYLNSIQHPHRNQIIESVAAFSDVESILEIGCASGANLVRLRQALPDAYLFGVDINRQGIKVAREYFGARNDGKIVLDLARADRLEGFGDRSVDIVMTDAVLMFITPDKIGMVVDEMARVARKGIILNEYNLKGASGGLFDGGRWIYDFPALFRKSLPESNIYTMKSEFSGGLWDTYGQLIVVNL